jgi:hypothetical protein
LTYLDYLEFIFVIIMYIFIVNISMFSIVFFFEITFYRNILKKEYPNYKEYTTLLKVYKIVTGRNILSIPFKGFLYFFEFMVALPNIMIVFLVDIDGSGILPKKQLDLLEKTITIKNKIKNF